MDASLLFNFLIWIILTVLLLFRVTLAVPARLFLVLALAFHVFFWWPELSHSFSMLLQVQVKDLFPLFLSMSEQAVLSLNWIWPLSLAYIFYLSSDEDSSVVVVFLTILSVIIWATYYLSLIFK